MMQSQNNHYDDQHNVGNYRIVNTNAVPIPPGFQSWMIMDHTPRDCVKMNGWMPISGPVNVRQ